MQRITDRHRRPCTLTPAVCVISSVFLCPLCPCPERLVGALCLNPLFGPPGEEIPFFWNPGCPMPLRELLSNAHINTNTHTCSHSPSRLLNTLIALPLVRHYQLHSVFSSPWSTSSVFYWPHQRFELSLSLDPPFGLSALGAHHSALLTPHSTLPLCCPSYLRFMRGCSLSFCISVSHTQSQ